MAEPNAFKSLNPRPDARLSRRSLVAAGALLATVGPGAISRAFALGPPQPGYDCTRSNTGCECFLRGTRLLTPDGEIAIEDLKIGGFVTTTDGEARAIRWIGERALARTKGWDGGVLPVRIAKGALGPNTPHRDLYVTRAHLLYLNGVLIPASDLINGKTISVVTPEVDTIEYFHIELGSHEVVLAEGAPCESLRMEEGQIPAFDNRAEYDALYGNLPRSATKPYASIAAFNGGRSELKSRLRSAISPVIDIRRPMDIARDDIELGLSRRQPEVQLSAAIDAPASYRRICFGHRRVSSRSGSGSARASGCRRGRSRYRGDARAR